MLLPQSFGARLRALRRARGLTQAELARRIGRHQTVIGPYERDEYVPPPEIVVRLAEALGSSPEYLLFGREPGRPRLLLAGRVGAAGQVVTDEPRDRPARLEAVAALQLAETLAPGWPAGWYVLVAQAALPADQLEVGRWAVVELADGRLLLRRLLPAADSARFDLAAPDGVLLAGAAVVRGRAVLGLVAPELLDGEEHSP